jgi:2,4-dienoyl-CoA reductase (NADPH2)
MARGTKFKKLMEPGYIGSVRTRNRILKTGSHAGFHEYHDGYVQAGIKDYYEAIARGGAGIVTMGAGDIAPPIGLVPNMGYRFDDDKYIAGMAEVVDIIHKYDCPAFIQMFHMGPMHPGSFTGFQPVASSSIPKGEIPMPGFVEARELTIPEIEAIVEKFAQAAVRAQKAGFDGIELNAGCNHLLNSFLSLAWNRRQDAYGAGSLESRAKIVLDIIKEIKRRNGKDFAVICLINTIEYGLKGGITPEESQGITQHLEAAGADAINARVEYYVGSQKDRASTQFPELIFYPEAPADLPRYLDGSRSGRGAAVPLAAAIKQVVSIPVIAQGRLDPDLGEKILRRGQADFISLNRRLMADPELPNKVAQGKLEDIAPCTACVTCFAINETGQPVRCRINASLNREREYALKPAERKKRVMVVGGGPAGMEAARVTALRGHEVTVYEKEHTLGGLLPLAALVKGVEREDLLSIVRYLRTQLDKLGVTIKLGTEVDKSLVDAIKPDVLVVAAGGIHNVPELPGIDGRNVATSRDLHRKLKTYVRFLGPRVLRWLTKFWMPLGKRVVIMGGDIHGCQIAEFLVKRGRKVTIVDTGKEIGEGLVTAYIKPLLLMWLADKGVAMMTEVKYKGITDKGLTIATNKGKKQTIEADTIVTALPLKPNTELLKDLKNGVPEVYVIGDSREPNLIIDAIADGSRIAHVF